MSYELSIPQLEAVCGRETLTDFSKLAFACVGATTLHNELTKNLIGRKELLYLGKMAGHVSNFVA